MMRNMLTLPLALLFLIIPLSAQEQIDDIRRTAAEFIALNNRKALATDEARSLLIGEALRRQVPSFEPLEPALDTIILLDSMRAVAKARQYSQHRSLTDVYIYFQYDAGWRISAVRASVKSMRLAILNGELQEKKKRTRAEEIQLKNYRLVISSDSTLRIWFTSNLGAMNALRDMVMKFPVGTTVHADGKVKRFAKIERKLQELALSGLTIHDDGSLYVVIGGHSDNLIGFVYTPTNTPPPIDPGNFIWVESFGGGWYLLRST